MTTHSTMSVNITVIHSYAHFVPALLAPANPDAPLCSGRRLWLQVDTVVVNVLMDSALHISTSTNSANPPCTARFLVSDSISFLCVALLASDSRCLCELTAGQQPGVFVFSPRSPVLSLPRVSEHGQKNPPRAQLEPGARVQ